MKSKEEMIKWRKEQLQIETKITEFLKSGDGAGFTPSEIAEGIKMSLPKTEVALIKVYAQNNNIKKIQNYYYYQEE